MYRDAFIGTCLHIYITIVGTVTDRDTDTTMGSEQSSSAAGKDKEGSRVAGQVQFSVA